MAGKMPNKVNGKMASRIDIAYTALRRAILEQALEPGTKLPEDAVGSGFDMSRTLAREVLAKLQFDGLVDIKRGRSARVASPSLSDANDIFHLRKILEGEVVHRIVEHWSADIANELKAHIREEETAAKAGKAHVSIRLAGEFHIKLAEMAGSHLLARFVNEVVNRCSLILALYGRPHSSECAVSEHGALFDAFETGNLDVAMSLMDRHIGSVEERALIAEDAEEKPDLHDIIGLYTDKKGGAM
jgi:DNA-binding GntR family transcriptional regulator